MYFNTLIDTHQTSEQLIHLMSQLCDTIHDTKGHQISQGTDIFLSKTHFFYKAEIFLKDVVYTERQTGESLIKHWRELLLLQLAPNCHAVSVDVVVVLLL